MQMKPKSDRLGIVLGRFFDSPSEAGFDGAMLASFAVCFFWQSIRRAVRRFTITAGRQVRLERVSMPQS